MRLIRQAVAELLGTAFRGRHGGSSGIAAERLSPGQVGLQLLQNSLITGAVLVALILARRSTRWSPSSNARSAHWAR